MALRSVFRSRTRPLEVARCLVAGLSTSSKPASRRGRGAAGRSEADAAAAAANAGAAKLSALTLAIKQIEHAHGKGSLMKFGDRAAGVPQVEVIPTGSLTLDHALGIGGLPRGRVVEMYGPESSGKTTVALHVVAEAQRRGGTCVFIDAEHALDPAYAKRIGVDVDNLYISQPDSGEQGLDIAETLIKSGTVDCVVIDSVAALVPKAELEGDMGDHHIALQARLMSQALRKLTGALNRSKCLLIFINQVRQKVGVVFGSNEVTTGGMALRFYASVRLEIRRSGQLKAEGEPHGSRIKVKVVKNKLAPPFGVAEFDMLYGSGLDRRGELIDLGIELGVIHKAGAWFSIPELPGRSDLATSWPLMLGQGREKAKQALQDNEVLMDALQAALRERMLLERDGAPVTPLVEEGAAAEEDADLLEADVLDGDKESVAIGRP